MKKILVLVVLFFGSFILFVRGCVLTDPLIFVLPQGYVGWVNVVFNQPAEPSLKRSWGRIVFEIPSSGTLRTSSNHNSGLLYYYYVDANGRKTKITNSSGVIHDLGSHGGGSLKKADGTTEIFPSTLRFFFGTKEQWEGSKK